MAKRLTEAEQWILSYTKEDMKSSFGDPHTLETNLRATGFDGNPIHINISEHPKIKQYIEYILTGKGKSPYEGRRVGYLANGSYHAPKVDGGGDMLWLNNHLIADPIVYNNGARIASNFRFGDSNTPTPTTTPPTTTPPTTTPPTTTPPTTIPPTPSTTVPPTPSTTVPHKRVPAVTGANGNQGSQGSQGAQGGLHVVLTPPGGSGGSSKQPIVTIYGTKPTAGSIEAALQSVFPGLSKGKLDDYRRLIAVSGRDGLSGQQQQTLINIFKASGVSYNLKNKIGIAYRNELSRALGTMFSSYSASYKGQTGSMAPMGQYLQDLVISGAGVNNPLTLAQQAAMDARAAAQAAAAAAREARMQSSIDIISEHLANMGFTDAQLKQLAPFVSSQVHSGITQTAVYADLRRTPQYAQRFPGNAERIKKGLAPFNEPQYIAYEDRTREIAQSYGLPNGALTAANIGHMITISSAYYPFNGTPRPVSTSVTPSGIPLSVTYAGSSSAPSAVGNYPLLAYNLADSNWNSSSSSGTLVIYDPVASWRSNYFGTVNNDGTAADNASPYGIGLNNLQAYTFGVDPTQPLTNALLSISNTGNNTLTLSFLARSAGSGPGYSGLTRYYNLEATTNLTNSNSWNPVPGYSNIPGSNQVISLSTNTSNGIKWFYRLKVWLQ